MNEQDQEAFEKWNVNSTATREEIQAFRMMTEHQKIRRTMEKAFQAALEYERERSKILVDALFTINLCYDVDEIARDALEEYKGKV